MTQSINKQVTLNPVKSMKMIQNFTKFSIINYIDNWFP